MGQQQLLLIILGVIIVGIAIAVGLQLFQAGSIGANQDAIVNDIMNVAAHADQFRIRPETMGGGSGEFTGGGGYTLPERLEETGNARFTGEGAEVTPAAESITIRAVSIQHDGWVQLVYTPNADPGEGETQYAWTSGGVFAGTFD